MQSGIGSDTWIRWHLELTLRQSHGYRDQLELQHLENW
jgi:hypothetical protein